MFNITEYMGNLVSTDPVMFVIQFIILPFGVLAGIIMLMSWYEKRTKQQQVNTEK